MYSFYPFPECIYTYLVTKSGLPLFPECTTAAVCACVGAGAEGAGVSGAPRHAATANVESPTNLKLYIDSLIQNSGKGDNPDFVTNYI